MRPASGHKTILPLPPPPPYAAAFLQAPAPPVHHPPLTAMIRPRLLRAASAASLIPLLATFISAAPADLDPTFGGTGMVFPPTGDACYGPVLLIQGDGKLVLGSCVKVATGEDFLRKDFALTRYSPDGTIDTGFGVAGRVVTPVSTGDDYISALAKQNDNAVVAAGQALSGSNYQMAMVRYLANGNLDTSFNGTGKIITVTGSYSRYRAVAVQPDQKIVGIGETGSGSNYMLILVRHLPDGSLDASFGGTGKVFPGIITEPTGAPNCIALQTDGKIVVATGSYNGTNSDFALIRYRPDGSLDTGFGGTGIVKTDFGGTNDYPSCVALQRDGKIIAAGSTYDGISSSCVIARYFPDGRRDFTCYSPGKFATAAGDTYSGGITGLVIQRNGKLMTAGVAVLGGDTRAVVARYLPSGAPDPSFAGSGAAILSAGTQREECSGISLLPDGRIVVTGHRQPPQTCAPFVARFEGDRLTRPILQVEEPLAVPLADGSTHHLGNAMAGGMLSRQFTLYNPGTVPLEIASTHLDGPDAEAFQITQSPAGQVAPDGSTLLTVQFATETVGSKTAVLHIVSNDTVSSNYDLTLTGTVFPTADPDIAVEQPAGTPLPASGTLDAGTTKAGVSASLPFLIRNTGVSGLTGLAFSFTGPDAGMFSVTGSSIALLPQGEVTGFSLRFLPTSRGIKSAVLHIASNDPDENPYRVNVTGTGFIVPGEPDPSFSTVTTNGNIYAMVVQPGGRILIGGSFTTVNGVTRNRIARLQANGALDPSVTFSASGNVASMAMQMDGRCVIGGAFGLARLNANGTLDSGFQSNVTSAVFSLGLQPDNKIVFLSSAGIRRALTDGKLDTGFNVAQSGSDTNSLAVFGSGEFVAADSFPPSWAIITRFASDGRRLYEQSRFYGNGDSNQILYSGVTALWGDGTSCGYYGGYSSNSGSSFSSSPSYPGQTSTEWMVGQADGKVIFSGGIRINADGTKDTGFALASAWVKAIQGDGGLLLASGTSPADTVTRRHNDPAIQSLTATDARRVQWLRGGAAPVSVAAQFDVSTDGGANWTLLGPGVLIPGGWELTGVNLPGSGKLRARARTASTKSYGLVETTADFTVTPVPRLAVLENGGELTSGSAVPVDFGRIGIGGSASCTFTLRNTGWGELTGLAVTLSGEGQPGDFVITPPALTTLAHGEETTFTTTLTPAAAGVRTGTLLVASNDVASPFRVNLTGLRSTVSEAWRLQYFGSPDNTGAGADLNDADSDGLVNLIEFATGGHPLEFTPPVGTLVKNGATLEFTYTRPAAAAAELSYQLQASITLSGTWTAQLITSQILSDDGITQVVRATAPAGTGKRSVRLRVTRL